MCYLQVSKECSKKTSKSSSTKREIDVMDFKQKIKGYKSKFRNENTLKFVDFLETLIEWTDTLYQTKRLGFFQKKKVDHPLIGYFNRGL